MALGDPCCHGHWCVQHWYGWKFPAWCAKTGRASSAGPRPTPQATSRTGRLVSVLSPLVYSCHHLVQPHHSSPRPSGSPLLPTPCLSQSSHQRAPVNTESGPAPSVQWSRVPISLGVKAQVLPWLTRPSAICTRTLPALPSSLSLSQAHSAPATRASSLLLPHTSGTTLSPGLSARTSAQLHIPQGKVTSSETSPLI